MSTDDNNTENKKLNRKFYKEELGRLQLSLIHI